MDAGDGWGNGTLLGRNLTVTGSNPLDQPVLDASYVRCNIQLAPGVWLTFKRVVLMQFRAQPLALAPGFDMLAPALGGEGATVAVVEGMIVIRYCYPPSLRDINFRGIQRAPSVPGKNSLQRDVPQPGCVNDTALVSLRRCWADRGLYINLAIDGVDIDDVYGNSAKTNYVVRMLNVSYVCDSIVSDACIAQYGPAGCILINVASSRQRPPPPPEPLQPPPPAPPLPPAPRPPEAGRSGGLSPTGRVLVAALVGGLGGLALLLGAAVLAYCLHSRTRKLKYRDQKRPSAGSLNHSSGSTDFAANYSEGGHASKGQLQVAMTATDSGYPPAPTPGGGSNSHVTTPGDAQSATATARSSVAHGGARSTARSTAESDLVVVTALTPSHVDVRRDAECGDELKLQPVTLGKGSFGHVVLGTYRGQNVAVKLLGDVGLTASGDPLLAESLQHEIEVLGRCDHPCIVKLLAVCLAPPRACLVMELMETSLDRLLYEKPGQMLPLSTVIAIAIDIARGLAFLHPTVVHRDLKPANVLITMTSAGPITKLGDFGLSRLRCTAVVTETPEAGTPAYIAPEAFEVQNFTITFHADIYAFGVLMAEMLAGVVPWPGLSPVVIATQVAIHRLRPVALHKLPPNRAPHKLLRLVESCWEQDPLRRPAAAEVEKTLYLVRQKLEMEGGLAPVAPAPQV